MDYWDWSVTSEEGGSPTWTTTHSKVGVILAHNGVTLGMTYRSIAYSLSGSEHVYWNLGLKIEVQSIWVSWTRRPSRMQVQLSFWRWARHVAFFRSGFKTKKSQVARGRPRQDRVKGNRIICLCLPLPTLTLPWWPLPTFTFPLLALIYLCLLHL